VEYGLSLWVRYIGIEMVISHIDMGHLVTLLTTFPYYCSNCSCAVSVPLAVIPHLKDAGN
jgi:hypothetical protein